MQIAAWLLGDHDGHGELIALSSCSETTTRCADRSVVARRPRRQPIELGLRLVAAGCRSQRGCSETTTLRTCGVWRVASACADRSVVARRPRPAAEVQDRSVKIAAWVLRTHDEHVKGRGPGHRQGVDRSAGASSSRLHRCPPVPAMVRSVDRSVSAWRSRRGRQAAPGVGRVSVAPGSIV